MSVVVFHLDFVRLGGGFVGVDIFFVISGYLIGKSILDQRRAGTFSLVEFYQKRLRRILPALVAVLTVVSLASLFVLFPEALEDYGASLVSAVFSLANIYFWHATDYFDSAAHEKPLLHTWSLGVEEQFYILLPLLLLLTRRAQRYDLWVIGGVGFASLVLSVVVAERYPTSNFYMISHRSWELMAGGLAAEFRFRVLERRVVREVLAALALLAIAAVCLFYTPATTFPGLTAIPPVLATAVLLNIGAQGPTLSGWLLSLRPAIWIGLISYSLYLWHWPVIVLLKQYEAVAWLRLPDRGVALALLLLLAWLSWLLVERPLRSPRFSKRFIWWFSGISSAALAAAGLAMVATNGLPQRFSDETLRLVLHSEESPSERAPKDDSLRCQVRLYAEPGTFVPDPCWETATDRPNVLLIGDSHSNHSAYGLNQRFPQVHFRQASAAGCRVTLEGAGDETSTCAAFRQELFRRIEADPPQWVLIGLFWGGQPFDSLGPTVDWLQGLGTNVIVAGPVARYEVPLPHLLGMSRIRSQPSLIEERRIGGVAEADERFAEFATEKGVFYMSNYAAMCPDGACVTVLDDGSPIQIDGHHLGNGGSYLVASQFPLAAVLEEPGNPASGD